MLQKIGPCFQPLDGVSVRDLICGPAGFMPYQLGVPDAHNELVPHTIKRLSLIGAPSIFTLLKRFGAANRATHSFLTYGLTLAKDSPQLAILFQRICPRVAELKALFLQLSPNGVFTSEFALHRGL